MKWAVAPLTALLAGVLPLCPATAGPRASFTRHRYAAKDPAFSRDYWVYVPASLAARHARVPLVVYLHGCTQTAPDAARGVRWNELAERRRFVVVYPEQDAGTGAADEALRSAEGSANGSRCWNWFRTEDEQRDAGEPATIAGLTRTAIARYGIDPARVYVIGASAGADMAEILAANYPDVYAAVGVVLGCAFPDCADPSGTLAYGAMGSRAREMPVFAVDGTMDELNAFPLSVLMVQQWLGTADLADDGRMNGSVSRMPASVADYGTDQSALAHLGTVGDACVRANQWPCLGAALGDGSTYPYSIEHFVDARGRPLLDFWVIYGLGHDYPGGDPRGTYTDPYGPNITPAAYEFFMRHPMPEGRRR
jgi:poly(hydroxyalkanoate) depolymerase family esterase